MFRFFANLFKPQPETLVNINVTAEQVLNKTIFVIHKLLAESQGQQETGNIKFYSQIILQFVKQNNNYYKALCERINAIKLRARTWQLQNLQQINAEIQTDLTKPQGIFYEIIEIWTHFHIMTILQRIDILKLSETDISKWVKTFLTKGFQLLINFMTSLIQFIFFRAYSRYVAITSKKVNRKTIRKDILRNISKHQSIVNLYKKICKLIKQDKYEYKLQHLKSTIQFLQQNFKISCKQNPFGFSIDKLMQFQAQNVMFEKINRLKQLDQIVKAQCHEYNPKIQLGAEVCNQVYVFLIWSNQQNLDGSLSLFQIFFCSSNKIFKQQPELINDLDQVKRVMEMQFIQFEASQGQNLFYFYQYFRDISRLDLINNNLKRQNNKSFNLLFAQENQDQK